MQGKKLSENKTDGSGCIADLGKLLLTHCQLMWNATIKIHNFSCFLVRYKKWSFTHPLRRGVRCQGTDQCSSQLLSTCKAFVLARHFVSQKSHLTSCRNCLGTRFQGCTVGCFIKAGIFHFGYQGVKTNINKRY